MKIYFDCNERFRTWPSNFSKVATLDTLKIKVDNGDCPNQRLDLNHIPSVARILSKEFTEHSRHSQVEVDFMVVDVALTGLNMLSSDICF